MMVRDEMLGNSVAEDAADDIQKLTFLPATKKRRRKVMPDDFPKRPLSAYNIFVKESRQKILADREKDQESSSKDLNMVKLISSLWRKIDPEERARIERMADQDVQRYRNEVRAYKGKRETHDELRQAKKIKTGTQEVSTVAEDRGVPSDSITETGASEETIVDQLERLLAQESKALQVARSSKFHQMKLLQQAQASHPQLASFLDASRQALGLSSLLQPSEAGEKQFTKQSKIRQRGGALSPVDARSLNLVPSLPLSSSRALLSASQGLRSAGNGRSGQYLSTALEQKLVGLRRQEARLRLMLTKQQVRDLRSPTFDMRRYDPTLSGDAHVNTVKSQGPGSIFAAHRADISCPWDAEGTQPVSSFERTLWQT